jgi:hypothetical protein
MNELLDRSSGVLWRRVGDDVLVARAEDEHVSKLSPPASLLWLLIGPPKRRSDVVEALVGAFEGADDEAAGRVVDELVRARLVIAHDDE